MNPSIEISKKDYLLFDLNDDKITNSHDFEIFKNYYGTSVNDKQYYAKCDFNQDQMIDINDLLIISKEYGKTID